MKVKFKKSAAALGLGYLAGMEADIKDPEVLKMLFDGDFIDKIENTTVKYAPKKKTTTSKAKKETR